MKKEIKKGVSVILCCYNSSGRIGKTLHALARQEFSFPVSWEIIMVDNASTDNTSTVANSTWKSFQTATPIQIIYEPLQGLALARRTGIRAASYSYLVFCDDDNWLTPGYVQQVFEILESSPEIAACGGLGIPVFETSKPSWFDEYKEAFALGSQDRNSENGRILNLYGAGLGVNRKMIEKLEMTDFRPFMTGRVGKKLSSSEDTELTYALILMGYKLHYSPQLQFYHFLPKERLDIAYLKKLFIAFGNDGPVRNLYYSMITRRFFHRQVRNWSFHLLLSLVRLIKYGILPPKKYGRSIYFNWNITYIRELMSLRSSYPGIKQRIRKIKGIAADLPHQ